MRNIPTHRDTSPVIASIKEMANSILPPNSKMLLYGSRARGDFKDNSDWDMIIILDKQKATHKDYDTYAFPFHMLGAEFQEIFTPIVYGIGQWKQMARSPFYDNVQNDKIDIL